MARRIAGEFPGGELGFRFGEPLDVDGDGRADIAAGARYWLQQRTLQSGNAAVWSGETGVQIRAWDGTAPDGLFGHWVLPMTDLDGDGLADLVISAPTARVDADVRGIVVARSPRSGKELWRRVGTRTENLGWDLSVAGDHDGDGLDDVFVGAPSQKGGRVVLMSGKDGSALRTYAPPRPVPTFGWYVARVDDLDGDGRDDLAAGAHLEGDTGGRLVGGAYVVSSASGELLHHWVGPDDLSGFGEVVAAVADLDGDGHGEIAVAAPRTNDQTRSRPGEVHVYSGETGNSLRRWSGSQPGELFGRMVVAAGDVDGDGIEDIAIGAPWHRLPRAEAGRQNETTGDGTIEKAGQQNAKTHNATIETAGEKTGRVEVRSGRSGAVLVELFGDEADCWFGWHIRRAPDPDGLGRPALLIGSLRHPVDGQAGVGVLDLYVLKRETRGPDQGTITRGARRSDIK